MPINFRFRLIPFIVAALAVALGVSLGQWQTRRGDEKQAIEDAMTQRASLPPQLLGPAAVPLAQIEYAPVKVRGSFVAGWATYLDNRPENGKAGFYVLMPFILEGSKQSILVMRGWVARDLTDRMKVPALITPAGIVELEGLVRKDAGHVMQLGASAPPAPGAIVQNLDMRALGLASGLNFLPYVLEQHSDNGDGLQRDWPRASLGIEKHRGYAFQWYGLALAALLFFIVTGFRRGSN
jgi:cytochrome oxidase assembly protein ShyY1